MLLIQCKKNTELEFKTPTLHFDSYILYLHSGNVQNENNSPYVHLQNMITRRKYTEVLNSVSSDTPHTSTEHLKPSSV